MFSILLHLILIFIILQNKNKKYRELLDIPEGYSVPFGIAVGIPDGNLPNAREVVYKVSRV
ncbi:hypothetical protein [Clostridioides difficile]|uniref:hypothetical protein n=1 Tax=Clostridioides difficile TaxID=1496 RepID=UPI001F431A0D|nr:hypothetical protein [Clostridioides difficile]